MYINFNLKTVVYAAVFVAAGAIAAEAATVSAVVSTGDPNFGTVLETGSSWTTPPATVTGSVGSVYASPFNDTTSAYFTVGSPGYVASPAVLSVAATDSFQLLWGTVDSYNAIVFSDGTLSYTVSGNDLSPFLTVNGGTGAIVDITTDFAFTTVSFYSNYPGFGGDTAAFEYALATPAPVPLPAAGLLLVGALGGLASLRRRKARAA